MRKRLVVVSVLILLLSFVGSSSADTGRVNDSDDVEDVMDLAEATHAHGAFAKILVHGLRTYEEWENSRFVRAEVRFWLADSDPAADRSLILTPNPDGSFKGSMYQAAPRREVGDFLGYANVYRSDARTVVAEFPKGLLMKGVSGYRWKAFLFYPCSRDPGVVCSPPPPDTHPGRVEHEL